MTYNDPTYWRERAEDIRVLAEKMRSGISKHMMGRIAEDHERLARTAEQRGDPFPRRREVVPAEVRRFAHRGIPASPPSAEFPDLEIPSFLRRGPATTEEVRASVASPAYRGSVMTTEGAREETAAASQLQSSGDDEVDASLAALEKALGLPPSGSFARKD